MYYWVLAWFKFMLYWCFFWDFSCLWSFHKTTIAPRCWTRSARLRPGVHRIEQMPLAQLRPHTVEISVFSQWFLMDFLKKTQRFNRLKEPTLKFHPQRLGYFYVTTSCRKRSGDFQISEIFFCEKSEAPGLMLVGSDRSVAAILPPGRMLWPKISRLQQLQKLGEST